MSNVNSTIRRPVVDSSTALVASGASAIIATSTTAVEVKSGATTLSGRKGVYIMANNSNNYLGFDASMTAAQGILLFKDQTIYIEAKETASIYLRRASGTGTVTIWEVA